MTAKGACRPGREKEECVRMSASLRSRRPVRRILRAVLALLAVLTVVTGWSLGHALTAPGGGSVAARVAEWARDHRLGPLVTLGEWITYQPPKVGGKPSFALTGPSAAAARHGSGSGGRSGSGGHLGSPGQPGPARAHGSASQLIPHRLTSPAGQRLHGEGAWRVLGTVHGLPAIFGTYLRPDKRHTSYVAGIVSMNQPLLRFQLRPGAADPGPGRWRAQATIPPGRRRGLLATFNGGFKIASSGGGFYLNGVTRGSLTRGAASLVYYRNGHVTVGVWGRDVRKTPQVVGIRQNLRLIVDHGKVPMSVDNNVTTNWGATLGGGYFVWRSGVGVTSDGRVIFVYGPALDVRTLAELLRRAGCVRAMQLDINPDWMSFMYYLPRHHPADPTPVNLLPDQVQAPDRYYSIANRDFTAVFAR
jgi:Phosphodiester glycosidase